MKKQILQLQVRVITHSVWEVNDKTAKNEEADITTPS